MFIFLYGPDSYRSREKLNQIIDKYKKSDKTQSGLFIFDEENFGLDKLNRAVAEQSFFSPKKLIVIKNIFAASFKKDLKEKIVEYFKKNDAVFSSKDTVVVFWQDDSVKPSDALFKFLTADTVSAKKQEFKNLTECEIKRMIRGELGEKLTIDESALEKLILYAGNDSWRLSGEVKKLSGYKIEGRIISEDVNYIVSGDANSNIFQAIDALGQKDAKKAAKEFKTLLEKGEEAMYLFSMIVYQFRNLIKVKDLTQRAELSYGLIAKKLKMHPFVAQKTVIQSKNFTLQALKNVYKKLLDFDVKIKTGKIDAQLAIDMIIYSLAEKCKS